MQYWLLKSEPNSFSITDLQNSPNQIDSWDGVRNYQARNFMRDQMKIGDQALFYHSRIKPSVVGIVEVVKESYPDHTAWDFQDHHFDPKSSPDNPIWFMVDVKFLREFNHPLPLPFLREIPELQGMELLRKGSRLSVQPVKPDEFETILILATDS